MCCYCTSVPSTSVDMQCFYCLKRISSLLFLSLSILQTVFLTFSADLVLSGATVYEVEQENWEEESSLPTIQQRLLLLLFLQHSDPFSSHLSDVMGERQLLRVESQKHWVADSTPHFSYYSWKQEYVTISATVLTAVWYPYSYRGDDRAPPGGYSEQQQTGSHSSPADWAQEHTDSTKPQEKGKSVTHIHTLTAVIFYIMVCRTIIWLTENVCQKFC